MIVFRRLIIRSCTEYRQCSKSTLMNNYYYRNQLQNVPYLLKLTNFKQFSSSNKKETITLNSAQKLKKAITEYGSTVIIFHIGISLISLGSCYLLVSSGLDIQQILSKVNLSDWIKNNQLLVSNTGNFAIAYAIHKVFAPVRIGITLGSVPFIVRYLRSKGILKK